MDQLDEYEQGEKVRKWIRQNGSSLTTGIALGLACVFGWQWWEAKGARHTEEAATQYTTFTEALAAKDETKANTFSALLTDKYKDTAYADLVVLRQAAFLQNAGKSEAALKLLEEATPKVKDPALSETFKLRLARLLLINHKAEDALKQVNAISTPRYLDIGNELRGDIQMALGHRDDARKAYEQALTLLDQAAPTRRLVELKLIDAGGQAPAQPET